MRRAWIVTLAALLATCASPAAARTIVDGPEGGRTDGTNRADVIHGAGGNDDIIGWDGDDQLFGEAGYDGLAGLDGDDLLDAGTENDIIWGADGDDELYGGAGTDILYGGPGRDRLVSRIEDAGGTDRLDCGRDFDTVQMRPLDRALDCETVTIVGRLLRVSDDVRVGGARGDVLLGWPGNDVLRGNAGRDLLIGHEGADRLDGGSGPDRLFGGPGRDRLLGGDGNDLVFATADDGPDRIDCGPGFDVAVVRPSDVVVRCERVRRTSDTQVFEQPG